VDERKNLSHNGGVIVRSSDTNETPRENLQNRSCTIHSLADLPTNLVLQPGSHGRRYTLFGPTESGNHADRQSYLIEVALEQARQIIAPEKPTRLACIFAFDQIANAQGFRDQYRQGRGSIYQIEPFDKAPNIHRGDMAALSKFIYGESQIDFYCRIGRQYWQAVQAEIPELLIGGPVIVKGKL
jgi:hypothetical protein